ncbi:MAG: DNA polymerase III subunit delta [Candidatus Yanofskybacteria bacterium]|nr:DNA polymerase III subunit delta [Candidatus Yanofskybacteria bacterium]
MLIFYYGPDGYRVQQKANQTIHRYREKYHPAINLFILDFAQNDYLATFEQALKNFSFFPEVKLIVAKNLFSQPVLAQSVAELIESHGIQTSKDIVVLLQEEHDTDKLSKSNKELFAKFQGKGATVEYFPLLESSGLSGWIKQECILRNTSITPGAAQKLLVLVGNDTALLGNELDKLVNYAGERAITEDDVRLLVATKIDLNIFDLIDAFAQRNKTLSFVLLSKELDQGRDPYYILTMIIYQLRNLLSVKDLASRGLDPQAIAKKAGLHPFVVRKAYVQAQKLPFEMLMASYKTALELDTDAKNGTVDLPLALQQLVLAA